MKSRIARVSQDDHASEKVGELLALAKNGLEARIVGKVLRNIGVGISRYGLFDAYMRERLADSAQEGITILASVGEYFSDNVTFQMSVREFDRLMDANDWTSTVAASLIEADILTKRGHNLSFGHELYFSAFSAEAVVRRSGMNAEAIASAVQAPKHSGYATLILGAIDNVGLLDRVLWHITDPAAIIACAMGECGTFAREWVDDRYRTVLQSVEQEARNVCFTLDEPGWMSVVPIPGSLENWSAQYRSFLTALPNLLGVGQYLDDVFRIVGIMDARLIEQYALLRDEARKRNIGLRSALFGTCFGNQNSDIAIGHIVARLGISLFHSGKGDKRNVAAWAKAKVVETSLTNGQVLMLLHLCRHLWDGNPIIKTLPSLIYERWRYAPYHLCLDLMDAARYSWNCSDEEKAALVAAIESIDTKNIMLSTSIVEALKALGALEDIGYEGTVRNEVDEVLRDPMNPESWALARSIYDRQFDHPYDSAYWEVLNALPDEKRKQFLSLAVRHKDEFRMFVSCMIGDLAKYEDTNTGEHIEHWTELPPKHNSMPQDAVGAFVVAHVVLGRLGYELQPKQYDKSDEDNAMLACGEIYYRINRKDVPWEEAKRRCGAALQVLLKHETGTSLPALKACEDALRVDLNAIATKEPLRSSIVRCFPDEIAEICREAVERRIPQQTSRISLWDGEFLNFAVHLLGCCGKQLDLQLLRGLVDDRELGHAATRAVRNLEERLIDS